MHTPRAEYFRLVAGTAVGLLAAGIGALHIVFARWGIDPATAARG